MSVSYGSIFSSENRETWLVSDTLHRMVIERSRLVAGPAWIMSVCTTNQGCGIVPSGSLWLHKTDDDALRDSKAWLIWFKDGGYVISSIIDPE